MDNITLARKLVEESAVLLKNDGHVLPFSEGQKIAFFGRTQLDAVYSGNGSGAAHKSGSKNILEECERCGLAAEPSLKDYYRSRFASEEKPEQTFQPEDLKKVVASGMMYEIFGKYRAPAEEYEVSGGLLQAAGAYTDTAVLVLGRNSGGEECDRHLQGDYYLTDSEEALAEQVCGHFDRVVLILNTNGLIDLSWTKRFPSVKSILFAGIFGEEGAAALAEILTGHVGPSGKLAVTIAEKYEDYPAADHFTWDKEHGDKILTYESYGLSAEENGSTGFDKSPVTVYREDIYAGYRYFDSFAVEPLYAFGHGLSYTDFTVDCLGAEKKADGIEVRVRVKNAGGTAGREVVQLYLTGARDVYQVLGGFGKTGLLQPQEEEVLHILVPWEAWSFYDEREAAYRIQRGDYLILAGNSSRSTRAAVLVHAEQDILVKQCANRLGIRACNRDKLQFITRPDNLPQPGTPENIQELCIREADVREAEGGSAPSAGECDGEGLATAAEPEEGCAPSAEKVKNLSLEQLAALCVGYGPGTPFAALGGGDDPETIFDENGRPLTTNSHPTGYSGYVSPAVEEAGIYSVSYKDGPAGVGEVAWPSEMLIACAFDRKLWYSFGDAVGAECEKQQVDVWLAPAVNLQRHPLGGRNFEYFSEDPYLTGVCACEIAKGVQENHPVLVCPKHFAVNEQETFRRGSSRKNYDAADSIVSERAARELYLKPFEMLVREAGVLCLMTSFNKINGVFAGGNEDLCTHILREEWGYPGVVVTDWGDMDIVVDGADAVAAGNDIVMPGGPPVIRQILQGYREGRVSREQMEAAVAHLLYMAEKTR